MARPRKRKNLPKSSFALPSKRKYPIRNKNDVRDAWRLAGHAKNPNKVRRNIIRIAKRKGLTSGLPDTAYKWAKNHKSVTLKRKRKK